MKDLAILVDNKNDSTEAQDLLFSMGYKWRGLGEISKSYFYPKMNKYFIFMNKNEMDLQMAGYFAGSSRSYAESRFKEITLPELHDLVVLKRNNRKDANVSEENCLYDLYLTESKELYFYHCGKNKWILSNLNGDDDYYESLKPIEKQMKEYLRKNNDGEYILEVTNEREAQEPHAKHWIEVPKGCDYLISVFGVNSFIDSDMFAKFKTKNVLWSRKPMKEYLDPENGYKLNLTDRPFFDWIEIPDGANFAWKSDGKYVFFTALEMGYRDAVVVWSRHTHPEELPFIDDEPLLQTETRSRLDQVAKNNDLRERYFGETSEDYRYWLEQRISRKNSSLNDQYAEIEKVRQSAWQKQEGGSHYKNLKIQPMQYALENKLDYAQANVVKYVTRHKEKNGKEDLLKAIHNLELMIEFYYGDEK